MSGEAERVLNFASNWIDANVVHASDPPTDPDELQRRYLADAVASGLTLEQVNAHWEAAIEKMQRAQASTEKSWRRIK